MKRLTKAILLLNFLFIIAAQAGAAPEATAPNSTDLSNKDRIMGAIMGVFIGDALGVGSHWYYDLDKLKQDYGPWISGYTDPKPDGVGKFTSVHKYRYEQGIRAGHLSQTGQLYTMLLESIAEKGGYDQSHFTSKVDVLFETLDGTSYSGLYTDQAVRETWHHRNEGIGWDQPGVGSNAITSEAAQMNVALAAVYFQDPAQLAKKASKNTRLFYSSDFTVTHSVSYALVVGGLIKGVPLEDIKQYIGSVDRDEMSGYAPYYDSRIQVETGEIVWDPEITFDPPHLIAKVYGQHCEIQQLLPAAYYLIHRYPTEFDNAVLAAINGGGNNMARSALTGGMSGAMLGLSGIPDELIEGLHDHERLLALAEKVADLAVR